MITLLRSLAVAVLAAPTIATAASAVLQSRESVLYATYFGGFAIVQASGSDGSLAPVTALYPPTLNLADDAFVEGSYLQSWVEFNAAWTLTQTWSVNPVLHTISGSGHTHVETGGAVTGPGCSPCLPTMQSEGRNGHALIFTLDAATPYSFESSTSSAQFMELQLWGEAGQRWVGLWSGPTVAKGVADFERSGTLVAGKYRVINSFADLRADKFAMTNDSTWSYTLTLPDAQISAVPEPVSAVLFAVGLGLLAWRHRGSPGAGES